MSRAARILIVLAAIMGADGVMLAAASAHGADASRLAKLSSISASQRFAAIGTRSIRVVCASTSPLSSMSTYSETAGGDDPAASVNCATTGSGSIVNLRPGM